MKKHSFTVEVEFESKITDDREIEEIANNLIQGLLWKAEDALAPEDSETFTERISVSNSVINVKLEVDDLLSPQIKRLTLD